jgi:tetratricopeptide (TPR) repeat protein
MRTCAAALAGGGGAAERARIALLEAQALVIKGQYADARGAAGNAAALAEQAGLPDVVAKARLTEAWITNWSLDEPLDAFSRIVKRAVDACQQAGDVPSEIEARHIGTNVLWSLGRIDEFVTVNEELVRLAEAAGDVTHVAAITARLVPAEFIRGNFEQGTRHLEVAESMAARYGFRNVALRTQFDRAMDQMWRGNLADAERRLREYRANAMEAGARQHEMSAVRFLGYTLVAADRPTEAAEVLDEALALSETTGERWNRAEVLALRAGAALAAGELEAAERFVQRAVAAARPDDLTAVSESQTQLGVIRAAQHREAEAEAAFKRAVEAVAGTPYVNIGIPAAVSFAIFLAERGRHDEAAAVAAPFLDAIEIRGLHLWDRIVKRYRRLDKTKRLV